MLWFFDVLPQIKEQLIKNSTPCFYAGDCYSFEVKHFLVEFGQHFSNVNILNLFFFSSSYILEEEK